MQTSRNYEGSNNPHAILTDAIVMAARRLHKPYSRNYSVRALAEIFKVPHTAMEDAISGRTWKHLKAD